MTEVFQPSQIDQANACWNNIQNNNKYHKDNFFTRLYSNLLINDVKLSKTIFNDDDSQIDKHALLFGDLFEFVILNLDNLQLCQEFIGQFQQENYQFIDNLANYIEPMGNSVINTLKQWIGPQNVDHDLQDLWVQIYCFIADEILELHSDADSTFSEEQPLQIKQPTTPDSDIVSPIPQVAKPFANLENGSVLSFSLDKNDKYKGFRRSVQQNYTPNNEPVTIPIPAAYTKPKSTISSALSSKLSSVSDFDPRSLRGSSSICSSSNCSIMTSTDTMVTAIEEPVLTPRSSKRISSDVPSLVRKLSERQSRFVEDSDSEEEEESNTRTFDPRNRKHSRSNSADYTNDLSQLTQTPKQTRREPVDSSSFGLAGLAPIIETDFDDSASSKYESGDENSCNRSSSNSDATDAISSGASTLSLHDRNSSLSSGTDPMSSPSPDFKAQPHVRTSSGSSSISYMKSLPLPPMMNTKFSRSTSSLLSEFTTNGKNSVSLGFMRSSFVLKKEMEELGFNIPENVTPDIPQETNITVGVTRLEVLSPENSVKSEESEESCFNYINAFSGSDSNLADTSSSKYKNPISKLDLPNTLPPKKQTFGAKLKSIFSKSKSNRSRSSSISVDANQSTHPDDTSSTTVVEETRSNNNTLPSSYLIRMASTHDLPSPNLHSHPYASRYESMKPPSVFDRSSRKSTSSRQESKVHSSTYSIANRSMSDIVSMGSENSSINGFSFYGSTNLPRSRSTRGNKYQVKAVPYNIFARGV